MPGYVWVLLGVCAFVYLLWWGDRAMLNGFNKHIDKDWKNERPL